MWCQRGRQRDSCHQQSETGEVVHQFKPSACHGLYSYSTTDIRSKWQEFTALEPGRPLQRQLDVSDLIGKLPDGVYHMKLESLGAWWCWGNLEEIFGDEERVPRTKYRSQIPPLEMACPDEVKLQVKDGKRVSGS